MQEADPRYRRVGDFRCLRRGACPFPFGQASDRRSNGGFRQLRREAQAALVSRGMMTDAIIVRTGDDRGIDTLTLNRPKAYNALNETHVTALTDGLAAVAPDASVHCVALEGADPAFGEIGTASGR